MALLEVENLSVGFLTRHGKVQAVDKVSFSLEEGGLLGIVGESGSGKSVTCLALMGLLGDTAEITADHISFDGRDLLTLSERDRRQMLGRDLAMIFQDPMTSLNPCFTAGYQICETLKTHGCGSGSEIKNRAIALLEAVGIPDPAARFNAYPHQLSGGMSQRVMIAMSIACRPRILIADEPTTALDVTIQAQILDLLRGLNQEKKMSLILISHDLAVVSNMVLDVAVMYAGQVVETGKTEELLTAPLHPYTQSLLNAVPNEMHSKKGFRLSALPGTVPSLECLPPGCRLEPRCPYATELCKTPPAYTKGKNRAVRCYYPLHSFNPSQLQGDSYDG